MYVLGGDLLQSTVNDLHHKGLLQLPICTGDPDYPIIQYANDTLLIMPAEIEQVNSLKEMLGIYSRSTGLKINFHKSSIIPVNVEDTRVQQIAECLRCKIGSLPFTYL